MAAVARPVIVLLRGINVGGKNRLAMADLRAIADDCGHPDAVTYVQSGNLVLPTVGGDIGALLGELHDAIQRRTGLDVALTGRTLDEWSTVIEDNPFPAAADDGTKLHVLFLSDPAPEALAKFDAAGFAPEQFAARGREVYLSLPDGIGRSKLVVQIGRLLAAPSGTVRNWNTVLKLATLGSRS